MRPLPGRILWWLSWPLLILLLAQTAEARKKTPLSIPINDRWDVLRVRGRNPDPRQVMAQAGKLLGDWKIELAGMEFTGAELTALAQADRREPFLRVVREGLKRPIDLWDFLLFVDDVLLAGRRGLRGKQIWVPPGRARGVGIMIHPDDVFRKNKPRRYPHRMKRLDIDRPARQLEQEPAEDGDLLGPRWTARYKNPMTREEKWEALAKRNPSGTFAARWMSLVEQLEAQGGDVGVYTTVRNQHRGYLMWGAFMLSKKKNRRQVIKAMQLLQRLNHEWELDVPIRWYHPAGWRATVEAARRMSDAYDVVYASRAGARKSRHYDGEAIDVVAFTLPRSLTLKAPDGAARTFDLSDPQHTRDLNLSLEMIEWVESHFQMKKLKPDYPHWDDAAEPDPVKRAEALAAFEPNPPAPIQDEAHKEVPAAVMDKIEAVGSMDVDRAEVAGAGPPVEAADDGRPPRPWPDWTLILLVFGAALWSVVALIRTTPHLLGAQPLRLRTLDRLWLTIPFLFLAPLARLDALARSTTWILFVFALSSAGCAAVLAHLNWPLF